MSGVEQRWFVGAHANVGGGYETDLLNQAPLRWLMKKAESHGLTFRADMELDGDSVTPPIADSYGKFGYGIYQWITSPYYRPIGADPEERDDSTPSHGQRDDRRQRLQTVASRCFLSPRQPNQLGRAQKRSTRPSCRRPSRPAIRRRRCPINSPSRRCSNAVEVLELEERWSLPSRGVTLAFESKNAFGCGKRG
ncbi:DUF2235 domain-containing protein [Bradyrhizobium sp. 131]|nr:DUF2235 domain-containing protein [Bradyrhizobium sp. 131]